MLGAQADDAEPAPLLGRQLERRRWRWLIITPWRRAARAVRRRAPVAVELGPGLARARPLAVRLERRVRERLGQPRVRQRNAALGRDAAHVPPPEPGHAAERREVVEQPPPA